MGSPDTVALFGPFGNARYAAALVEEQMKANRPGSISAELRTNRSRRPRTGAVSVPDAPEGEA
jgi:rRNA processing protein Krr1/Pno1